IILGPDCTMGSLDAGASRTCMVTGTAERDLHTNIGMASGTADVMTVTGPRTVIRTANDDDAYFGVEPKLSIVKKTGTTESNATDNNGGPARIIRIQTQMLWTYTVTNTGNVALTEVAVT